MKVLISACLLGRDVRWNGANKKSSKVTEWAKEMGFELVPVCPEDELFGTPRKPIRLIQIGEKRSAMMGNSDVLESMEQKAKEIYSRHHDAVGFIGIYNSPSCGISVGVKNLGKTVKGTMHEGSPIPTTEIGYLKNPTNRKTFRKRIEKKLKSK